MDPDNTNNLAVALLPDALGYPSALRALRASVVNYPAEVRYKARSASHFNSSAD